jgi:hypothetical protein
MFDTLGQLPVRLVDPRDQCFRRCEITLRSGVQQVLNRPSDLLTASAAAGRSDSSRARRSRASPSRPLRSGS